MLLFFFNLSDRVQDAYWNLRKAVKSETSVKAPAKASKLSIENQADGNSEHNASVSSNEELKGISREPSSVEGRHLLDVVSFQRENVVMSRHPPEKRYDTILWYIVVFNIVHCTIKQSFLCWIKLPFWEVDKNLLFVITDMQYNYPVSGKQSV